MSLDKAIEHHKEKRQMYRGSKAFDYTCRNHGSCEWCRQNRQHKFRDKKGDDTMRIETKYFADDDTEFETQSECEEYERSLKANFASVLLFDDAFNLMENPTYSQLECIWYIKVLDGEGATNLIDWINDTVGICMDGLPDELVTGQMFAWDNGYGTWYDPVKEAKKYQDVVNAIEKAVSAA